MNNLKLTVDSAELSQAIKFIGGISHLYSNVAEGQKSNSAFILFEAKDGKVHLTYAHQGTYIKVKIKATVESDGFFVSDPFLLESLPVRAKVSSIETLKDGENNFHLKYSNGSVKHNIIVHNNKEIVTDNIPNKASIPSKGCTIQSSQVTSILNTVMFNSTDPAITKQVGLPLHLIIKKNRVTIQTSDAFCAILYSVDLKEEAPSADILTQGVLLKAVLGMYKNCEIEFSSNNELTRLKSSKFEVVVPTRELVSYNIYEWFKKEKNPKHTLLIKTEDISSLVSEVCVVSKLANIDPVVSFNYKGGKLTITNESTIGRATATVKAECKKEMSIRYNALWFLEFANRIKKGNVVISVYNGASVMSDETGDMKCIIPFM